MPFNQQMSFPCELTLRSTSEGLRMCRQPVREIGVLYGKEREWSDEVLEPGANFLSDLSGDLFDIQAEIAFGSATDVGFRIGTEAVSCSFKDRTLSCLGRSAPLEPVDGRVRLRVCRTGPRWRSSGTTAGPRSPPVTFPARGNGGSRSTLPAAPPRFSP